MAKYFEHTVPLVHHMTRSGPRTIDDCPFIWLQCSIRSIFNMILSCGHLFSYNITGSQAEYVKIHNIKHNRNQSIA